MSGGSYDYLYLQVPETPAQLEQMAKDAEEEGFAEGAKMLRGLLENFSALQANWSAGEDFIRAFEWMHSGDYGRDQVKEAESELGP